MPNLSLSNELFSRLQEQAEASGLSIEAFLHRTVQQAKTSSSFESDFTQTIAFQEEAFERIGAVQLLIDPTTGAIVDANPTAALFYGYSAEQLRGMTLDQLNTLSMEEIKVEMNRAIRQSRTHFNFQHRLASGEVRDVLVYSGPVNFFGTDLLYSIIVDITPQKQAEAALQEKEHRLKMAIRGGNLGTWELNLETGEAHINDRYLGMIGYTSQEFEINFDNWPSLIHPDDIDGVMQNLNAHLRGESDLFEVEYRMRAKNGDWVWIYDSGVVSRVDENGKPVWMSGTHSDITQRKIAEQQRLEYAMMRERTHMIQTFIKDASHEFFTPLAVIDSSLYLLRKQLEKGGDVSSYLSRIEESTLAVQNLVHSLNNIVRLDLPTHIRTEQVQVGDLIHYTLERIEDSMHAKDQNLTVTLPPDLPPTMVSTEDVCMALLELFKNANQFTPKGGHIHIEAEHDAKHISILVMNSGDGIPSEEQDRVFQPFYRLDKAHTTRGFGLGLAMVRKVMEQHHGAVLLESKPGQGTWVRLILPIAHEAETAKQP